MGNYFRTIHYNPYCNYKPISYYPQEQDVYNFEKRNQNYHPEVR